MAIPSWLTNPYCCPVNCTGNASTASPVSGSICLATVSPLLTEYSIPQSSVPCCSGAAAWEVLLCSSVGVVEDGVVDSVACVVVSVDRVVEDGEGVVVACSLVEGVADGVVVVGTWAAAIGAAAINTMLVSSGMPTSRAVMRDGGDEPAHESSSAKSHVGVGSRRMKRLLGDRGAVTARQPRWTTTEWPDRGGASSARAARTASGRAA
ncbi:hypothetical protein HCA44_20415 [Rhodococcus sp. HNM0569]|nr:hypothetical protein [Rhodococcus sp. HNM0569]